MHRIRTGKPLIRIKTDGGMYMEFVTLNNGVKMPMEGFGVFQVPEAAVC